jgi:hypothetical protein
LRDREGEDVRSGKVAVEVVSRSRRRRHVLSGVGSPCLRRRALFFLARICSVGADQADGQCR